MTVAASESLINIGDEKPISSPVRAGSNIEGGWGVPQADRQATLWRGSSGYECVHGWDKVRQDGESNEGENDNGCNEREPADWLRAAAANSVRFCA